MIVTNKVKFRMCGVLDILSHIPVTLICILINVMYYLHINISLIMFQ